jgi:hypothetical protein
MNAWGGKEAVSLAFLQRAQRGFPFFSLSAVSFFLFPSWTSLFLLTYTSLISLPFLFLLMCYLTALSNAAFQKAYVHRLLSRFSFVP